MAEYKYHNEDISRNGVGLGWITSDYAKSFDCVIAVKHILEKHNHTFKVELYMGSFLQSVPDDIYIRETEGGYYITSKQDELNYAFFSHYMNCAKTCAKAVLEEFKK